MTRRARGKEALSYLALFIALLSVPGCTHVHPYERGRLAHPTMVAGTLSSPGEAHLYAVHEGAAGGAEGAEGGCGCN